MLSLELTIAIVVVCLLAEAYFSSSEIGLLSAKRARLLMLADAGNTSARLALALLEAPERLFGTTLLGTNAATVTAATVLSAYCITNFGKNGDFYAALIFSPMTMILGEIIPKSVAQVKADGYSLLTARPLSLISRFLTPGHLLFGGVSSLINKILGPRSYMVTKDDLKAMLDMYFSDLQATDRHMIGRIFDFGEKRVYEAMKPLIEVVAIPETATIEEAVDTITRRGFSRLPVYRERIDEIIGVVNAFDLFYLDAPVANIGSLVRPVFYIPQSASIDDAFHQLHTQPQRPPFAVVVNEYGGAVGIISVEDLLEEIVGEIEDEYDRDTEFFRQVRKGVFDVGARMKIEELFEKTGLMLPEGNYETVGGMLLEHFGQIPKAGDKYDLPPYAEITVIKATEKAIKLVRIRLTDKATTVAPSR